MPPPGQPIAGAGGATVDRPDRNGDCGGGAGLRWIDEIGVVGGPNRVAGADAKLGMAAGPKRVGGGAGFRWIEDATAAVAGGPKRVGGGAGCRWIDAEAAAPKRVAGATTAGRAASAVPI